MKRSASLAVALVLTLLPTGCVTPRFLITSDPPGAIVFRDGQPIGATPVESPFVYYGKYHFRLVKDGYEPLDVDQEVAPPWYEIVGIDFFSENIWPFTLRDKQCFHYTLQPLVQIPHDELRRRAEELRGRGQLIQPPPGVVLPQHPSAPTGTPVLPAPVPVPPGSPLPPPVPGPPPAAGTSGPPNASIAPPQAGITRPAAPSSPLPSP